MRDAAIVNGSELKRWHTPAPRHSPPSACAIAIDRASDRGMQSPTDPDAALALPTGMLAALVDEVWAYVVCTELVARRVGPV